MNSPFKMIRKPFCLVKGIMFKDRVIANTDLGDRSVENMVNSLNDAYEEGRKSVVMAKHGVADKNGHQIWESDWEIA